MRVTDPCNAHIRRSREDGNPSPAERRPPLPRRETAGMRVTDPCNAHIRRSREDGNPSPAERRPPLPRRETAGMRVTDPCNAHIRRSREDGNPSPAERRPPLPRRETAGVRVRFCKLLACSEGFRFPAPPRCHSGAPRARSATHPDANQLCGTDVMKYWNGSKCQRANHLLRPVEWSLFGAQGACDEENCA